MGNGWVNTHWNGALGVGSGMGMVDSSKDVVSPSLDTSSRPITFESPTATSEGTLESFLSSQILPTSEMLKSLWLTVADEAYLDKAVGHLDLFLNKVNWERQVRGSSYEVLLVLCLDEGCVRKCEERGILGYGGYAKTWPRGKGVNRAVWSKMNGEYSFDDKMKRSFDVDDIRNHRYPQGWL
jgi:hypothetical protein